MRSPTYLRFLCLLVAAFVAAGPMPTASASAVLQDGPSFAELAEQGLWSELLSAAEQQLALQDVGQDAGQAVAARAWLGRASAQRALLLLGGDEFSQDLGAALLQRATEELAAALGSWDQAAGSESLNGLSEHTVSEWWFEARYQGARYREGADASLKQDLEQAWKLTAQPYAAFLRGWMEWVGPAGSASSNGPSRAPDVTVLSWLERASDAAPDRALYALSWAEAAAAAGDSVTAADAWQRALDGEADDNTLLKTLLLILPGAEHAEARLTRLDSLRGARPGQVSETVAWAKAHALDQLGRGPEAEAALASVDASTGRSPAYDRAHASLLLRLERFEQAVALLQPRASARDWEAFSILLDVADTLGLARRWEEALAVYDMAMEIEHRDERAARNRALTLWRSGRKDKAKRAWDELLVLLPERSDLLNDAALAAAGAGDAAGEKLLLEAAIGLPGSQDARENLAAWHLGHPSGSVPEAVRLLEDVLRQEPERDRALYLRFRAGRPD